MNFEADARPRMGGKRAEAEVRIAELLIAGWTEVGLVMDGVRGFVASGGRQPDCCLDEGIDCCPCMTGRHSECPDCAQYDPPDEDDDWPDEDA